MHVHNADIAAVFNEIAEGGSCALQEQLRHELPPGIATLLHVPGLGPKRVKLLNQELGIHTPQQQLQAAQAGQLRTVRGFGEKAERRLLEAVQSMTQEKRFSIAVAAQVVERLVRYLKQHKACVRAEAAGSFRRMKETVGDLDVVASSRHTEQVTQHFVEYDAVQRLDLNDGYCLMAKEEGVLACIDSDAHTVGAFNDLRFGVGQARRA